MRGALMVALGLGLASITQGFTVSSDFEGGSCRVIKIDDAAQSVEVMPGGDPQRGWPCWWYFRLDGCKPGTEARVRLRGSDAPMLRDEGHQPLDPLWAMPQAAFISVDGEHWAKTEPGQKEAGAIVYGFTPEEKSVYVAWGPAFTPSQAIALVKDLAIRHPAFAMAEELCKSRAGRAVPLLHLVEGDTPAEKRPAVWIEARQHAWESGSSWVARGCMEWLTGDDPAAGWLRQHAEVFCVPIMDVDNTATGNGGKDEFPQDHNRDWSASPHWNEVVAAQDHVRHFVEQDRMAVFLDLHNPAPSDKKAFFYALPAGLLKPAMVSARDKFIATATAKIGRVYPTLEKAKEDGPAYHPLWRQISGTWVSMNGNKETVGICLETAWNIPECSTEGYLKVGAALAAAIPDYLRTNAR